MVSVNCFMNDHHNHSDRKHSRSHPQRSWWCFIKLQYSHKLKQDMISGRNCHKRISPSQNSVNEVVYSASVHDFFLDISAVFWISLGQNNWREFGLYGSKTMVGPSDLLFFSYAKYNRILRPPKLALRYFIQSQISSLKWILNLRTIRPFGGQDRSVDFTALVFANVSFSEAPTLRSMTQLHCRVSPSRKILNLQPIQLIKN